MTPPSELSSIIRDRLSRRAFSPDPVSEQNLNLILEAARWAASSYNEQPWRFILARKSDGRAYERILHLLSSFNQVWAQTAPVLMVTAAKRTFSHNGTPNVHAMHDAGAALAQMALQATALGLSVHPMAGFDRDRAHEELGIPDDYEMGAAVALGYPGSPDDLPQPYRDRELAPRQRKPLEELVFEGSWGHVLSK